MWCKDNGHGAARSRGDTTATASAQTGNQYPYSVPLRADLAELLDRVEGVSTAAQKARDKGNITLAEVLQNTRFEVYEGYLAELHHQLSQAVDDQEAKH
jgi:hypothetical protein